MQQDIVGLSEYNDLVQARYRGVVVILMNSAPKRCLTILIHNNIQSKVVDYSCGSSLFFCGCLPGKLKKQNIRFVAIREGGKTMRRVFVILTVLSFLLALQVTSYAAPPVEGFMGVPWGASRQQVQKAMEERGFKLLEQRADGVVDTYQGTFTGQPAELNFQYEKNVFFYGSAAFLHVKGQSLDAALAYYQELKGLLTNKYGVPMVYADEYGREKVSRWEGLAAAATPPGQVSIQLMYGKVFYGTGYLGNGLYQATGVAVNYGIGSAWARQKAVKDVNDL